MKKIINGKVLSIAAVVIIIAGCTAILGFAIAASQNAADREVVVNYTPNNGEAIDEDSGAPAPTSDPLAASVDSGPRPQDLTWDEACDIVVKEIARVFGADVSGDNMGGSYLSESLLSGIGNGPARSLWDVGVYNDHYRYSSTLDAVTGQITTLYFCDLTKSDENTTPASGPKPGDHRYHDAASMAMKSIDNEATNYSCEYHSVGSTGTQALYWMIVTTGAGKDYVIGITIEDLTFAGYACIDGPTDSSDSGVVLGSAIPEVTLFPGHHDNPYYGVDAISEDADGRRRLDSEITAMVVCPALGVGSALYVADEGSEVPPIEFILPVDEEYMSDVYVVHLSIKDMFPNGFEGYIWAVARNPYDDNEFASGKIDVVYDPDGLYSQSLCITYDGFEVYDVTACAGETFALQAQIEPAIQIDEPIVWTSSDTSVFVVEADNPEGTSATVTIAGSGVATRAVLTVTLGGLQAECTIRVD